MIYILTLNVHTHTSTHESQLRSSRQHNLHFCRRKLTEENPQSVRMKIQKPSHGIKPRTSQSCLSLYKPLYITSCSVGEPLYNLATDRICVVTWRYENFPNLQSAHILFTNCCHGDTITRMSLLEERLIHITHNTAVSSSCHLPGCASLLSFHGGWNQSYLSLKKGIY